MPGSKPGVLPKWPSLLHAMLLLLVVPRSRIWYAMSTSVVPPNVHQRSSRIFPHKPVWAMHTTNRRLWRVGMLCPACYAKTASHHDFGFEAFALANSANLPSRTFVSSVSKTSVYAPVSSNSLAYHLYCAFARSPPTSAMIGR